MRCVIVSRSIECKNGVDEEREKRERNYGEELEYLIRPSPRVNATS